MTITWDSNPHAFGAICARIPGRTPSVGAIWTTNGRVKGHLLGDVVYDGDNEQDAMQAVQEALDALPLGVINEIKDKS